ncbi:MAG TPA: hypothetical protein VMX76_00425 [Nevskiaceae bacterium]|nr:hypothetical protein [Nevskiaceae bacterium]
MEKEQKLSRPPVVQKHPFGCGVACTAFILNLSYQETLKLFGNGKEKACNFGFSCEEIAEALNNSGGHFEHRHIKDEIKGKIYQDNTIVFIKRSKQYPTGHYLCRFKGLWMDPWINFPQNQNIKEAKAGFRIKLPDKAIYAILQKEY